MGRSKARLLELGKRDRKRTGIRKRREGREEEKSMICFVCFGIYFIHSMLRHYHICFSFSIPRQRAFVATTCKVECGKDRANLIAESK